MDKILAKFWFEVRTQKPALTEEQKANALANNADPNPNRYTIASLCNLRNGLSRCLNEHSKNIDLTMDENFRLSQNSIKDACKDLKQIGKVLSPVIQK